MRGLPVLGVLLDGQSCSLEIKHAHARMFASGASHGTTVIHYDLRHAVGVLCIAMVSSYITISKVWYRNNHIRLMLPSVLGRCAIILAGPFH